MAENRVLDMKMSKKSKSRASHRLIETSVGKLRSGWNIQMKKIIFGATLTYMFQIIERKTQKWCAHREKCKDGSAVHVNLHVNNSEMKRYNCFDAKTK